MLELTQSNDSEFDSTISILSTFVNGVTRHLPGHETSLADEFAVASRARVDEDVLVKISRNLGMSHTSNTETVLREWKAMVHPPSYNQRTCLADAVFPVLGAEVADAILSGKYIPSTYLHEYSQFDDV